MKRVFIASIAILLATSIPVGIFLATFGRPSAGENLLEEAITLVREEAVYAGGSNDLDDPRYRLFVALSAMEYVQTNLSSARYGAIAAAGEDIPSGTEMCLLVGAGICGNHVQAFMDIVQALDVPAREVQIFYESGGRRLSHIVAEVAWNGEWHMFDVTWGFLGLDEAPYDVMSLAELRARPAPITWFDEAHPWTVRAADPFSYLSSPADVMTDGNGVIHPYIVSQAPDRVNYGLLHLPAFVGRALRWSGDVGEVVQEVPLPPGFSTLTIEIGGRSCDDGQMAVDGETYPVADKIEASVSPPTARIAVAPGDKACHYMIEALFASR